MFSTKDNPGCNLETRADKGLFMGFSQLSGGVLMYLPEESRVVTRSHSNCIFIDEIAPTPGTRGSARQSSPTPSGSDAQDGSSSESCGYPRGGVHGGPQGVLTNEEAQGPGSTDPGGQQDVLIHPESRGPGSTGLGGHKTDLKQHNEKRVMIDGHPFVITPCVPDIHPAFRDPVMPPAENQDYSSMAGESNGDEPSTN